MDTIPNPDSPSEPIEATREMIVGYISFVNPELEKIKTDDGKVGYNYTFGGAIFDDSLQVVANGTGGAASIVYEKTNTSGQIMMQIGCTPKR